MAKNDKSNNFEQIDKKLEAARGNIQQGELGKEYAIQKLFGMKGALESDQKHLIEEAHLAQNVRKEFYKNQKNKIHEQKETENNISKLDAKMKELTSRFQ